MTKRVIYSNVMRLYIPDNKVSRGRTDISVNGLVLGEVLDSDWWRHTPVLSLGGRVHCNVKRFKVIAMERYQKLQNPEMHDTRKQKRVILIYVLYACLFMSKITYKEYDRFYCPRYLLNFAKGRKKENELQRRKCIDAKMKNDNVKLDRLRSDTLQFSMVPTST